jgi:2-oxoglutarate ferredoxin oxidoreductase subunit gamma
MKSIKKSSRYEIKIAGSGGQGIILAGIMLAEAGLLDGKHVAQSQIYGAEVRGGNSVSEVILSDTEIDYPESIEVDLLVALTQKACDQNITSVKEQGMVIVDSDEVPRVFWENVVRLPFGKIASDVGESRAVNIAALGALIAVSPVVSRDSLVTVMARRLPESKVAVNLKAFDEALKLASSPRKSLRYTKDKFEI